MTGNSTEKNSSDFISSVERLSGSDIGEGEEKKKRIFAVIFGNSRLILLLFFCAALTVSLIYVGNAVKHYIMADTIYGNVGDIIGDAKNVLQPMLASPAPVCTPDYAASQELSEKEIEDISGSKKINKEYERIRSKLITLKAQYPNLYGWITIPNTDINFPVMQTTNNDYYLDHSYTGAKITSGAIFVDYRCEDTIDKNYNLVVYGHHMVYGGMFRSLDKLLDKTFFKDNDTYYFYTIDGMYTYRFFSIYETTKDYPYIRTSFSNDAQFLTYAQTMQNNSTHKTTNSIVLNEGDKIMTLSTCTNRLPDGRIAVHAVLVDRIS